MSDIIQFPTQDKYKKSAREKLIDEGLKSIPEKARQKIRFEILKMVDGYNGFFTEWKLDLPKDCSETLKQQIYDTAREEYKRKALMLQDIIKLKLKVLVTEYHQRH